MEAILFINTPKGVDFSECCPKMVSKMSGKKGSPLIMVAFAHMVRIQREGGSVDREELRSPTGRKTVFEREAVFSLRGRRKPSGVFPGGGRGNSGQFRAVSVAEDIFHR